MRLFLLLFTLLFTVGVQACSTTKGADKKDGDSTTSLSGTDSSDEFGEDGYGVDGQDLEAFAEKPGGEEGERAHDRVFFGYDSAALTSNAQETLTKQAAWLRDHTDVRITVEGHCDERGTREYNLALGEKRANAAKSFLVGEGVSSSRVSVVSYGKERPVSFGGDEETNSKNRRAVTVLNNYR
ncbi:MAG: peptidoglycan-associated lipoprotein Pal [Rickettsiales bacterium]